MLNPHDLGLPLNEWREGQFELVEKIVKSNKTLIIQAPPGYGKSEIAVGAARMYGGKTCILTATRSLQNQYYERFKSLVKPIYGRQNYPCVLDMWDLHEASRLGAVGVECDDAPCTAGYQCSWVDRCPYFVQRDEALASSIIVTNYSYFLKDPIECDMVVCDEGHLFDKVLGEEVVLPYDHIPTDIDSLLKETRKALYTNLGNERPYGKEERYYRRKLEAVERAIAVLEKGRCIVSLENGKCVVRSVWGQWKFGSKSVIMSGTLEPIELFARFYGIEDYEFVNVPWTFEAERRPLYYRPVTRVSGQNVRGVASSLARMVDWYLRGHSGEKGLIHSVSYALAEAVYANMQEQDRVIVHRRGDRREEVIARFRADTGDKWLMSPGVGVGEDFPFDAARSQIILKLPWPNRGDRIVQARMREWPEWYSYVTAQALWQMYGRVMRDKDDFGETIIFDETFDIIVKAGLVPNGIQEAIR